MDVQEKPREGIFPLSHLAARELFFYAENRTAAVFYAALAIFAGFLFARTHAIFSAYPFGIALLSVASRRVPFVLAGCLAGALSLGERGYAYCAVLALVLFLRLLLSYPRTEGKLLPASPALFREEPPLRLATCAVASLFPALYELAVGGLSGVSVAYALSMALIPTAAAFAYLYFYESGEYIFSVAVKERQNTAWRDDWRLPLSLSAFGFTLLLSLRGSSLLGISLPLAISAVLGLLLSCAFGLLRGTVAATLVSLGTLSPALFIPYAALASVSTLLRRLGVFPMLVAATAAAGGAAFLFMGVDAVISFFPEVAVAAALSYPVLVHMPRFSLWVKGEGERATEPEEAWLTQSTAARLLRLSAAYTDIGGILGRIGTASARPSEAEYYAACRRILQPVCADCKEFADCHEKSKGEGKKVLLSLCAQSAGGIAPMALKIPDNLLSACPRRTQLLSFVQEGFAELGRGCRRAEPHTVLSGCCATVSELLSDTARAETREVQRDDAACRRVREALTLCHATARGICVLGERKKRLLLTDLRYDESKTECKHLMQALADACACRLGTPVLETGKTGELSLRAKAERRYAIACAHAGSPRDGEISGDTFVSFEGEGDLFYALLSDGMGSGREAAVASGITGAYLSGVLSAGLGCEAALRSLNRMLTARGSECSVTVDLLSVDLLSGRAAFIKSGAAVSYVRRGDSLFRIRATTLPVGILPLPDAEKTEFDLQAGDVIVMLSDGISTSPDDVFWLCELLTSGWEGDLSHMAERILAAARRENSPGDDMTVALLSVKEAP